MVDKNLRRLPVVAVVSSALMATLAGIDINWLYEELPFKWFVVCNLCAATLGVATWLLRRPAMPIVRYTSFACIALSVGCFLVACVAPHNAATYASVLSMVGALTACLLTINREILPRVVIALASLYLAAMLGGIYVANPVDKSPWFSILFGGCLLNFGWDICRSDHEMAWAALIVGTFICVIWLPSPANVPLGAPMVVFGAAAALAAGKDALASLTMAMFSLAVGAIIVQTVSGQALEINLPLILMSVCAFVYWVAKKRLRRLTLASSAAALYSVNAVALAIALIFRLGAPAGIAVLGVAAAVTAIVSKPLHGALVGPFDWIRQLFTEPVPQPMA